MGTWDLGPSEPLPEFPEDLVPATRSCSQPQTRSTGPCPSVAVEP